MEVENAPKEQYSVLILYLNYLKEYLYRKFPNDTTILCKSIRIHIKNKWKVKKLTGLLYLLKCQRTMKKYENNVDYPSSSRYTTVYYG